MIRDLTVEYVLIESQIIIPIGTLVQLLDVSLDDSFASGIKVKVSIPTSEGSFIDEIDASFIS